MLDSTQNLITNKDQAAKNCHRPTCAEISLDSLASNFRIVKELVGASVKVMAVVKADAYGHGAVQCAKRLEAEGADWFGVALPEEGVELRNAGITRPILCFGGFWRGQEGLLIEHNLVPAVYRLDMLGELDRVARRESRVLDVHVKIDTGMGRLGVRYDAATEFAESARVFKNIRIDGLMTHFASADEPTLNEFTKTQVSRYESALQQFEAKGFRPSFHDLCNSAATVSHPFAYGNMVRPGGILYGLWRDILQPSVNGEAFQNVMSVYSSIALLKRVPKGDSLGYGCTFRTSRDSVIATLPIGYHDGFVRANSNRGRVIIRGHYAPVVGRVSMDLTIVDVTDVPGVRLDDRAIIIGEDGALSIHAEEMAKLADTISYEITCGISGRVPRVYV